MSPSWGVGGPRNAAEVPRRRSPSAGVCAVGEAGQFGIGGSIGVGWADEGLDGYDFAADLCSAAGTLRCPIDIRQPVPDILAFHGRQDRGGPTDVPGVSGVVGGAVPSMSSTMRSAAPSVGRDPGVIAAFNELDIAGEALLRGFVVDRRHAELLEVVHALGLAGGGAGRLDGGDQERDQRADDGDHDQEFDEREAGRPASTDVRRVQRSTWENLRLFVLIADTHWAKPYVPGLFRDRAGGDPVRHSRRTADKSARFVMAEANDSLGASLIIAQWRKKR